MEDLLAPIPGDNPSGTELRYEPLYDQIKEARRDETDLPPQDGSAPKRADWPTVVKLAEGALREQTKDLQISAWLTEALLHRDGFGGLAEGLKLTKALLDTYWDTVFPELDGGDADFRAAPLNWLGIQLTLPIQRVPINSAGHDFLEYQDALDTPSKEEAESDAQKQALRDESSLMPEDAEAGFQTTTKAWFKDLLASINASVAALDSLNECCDARFADSDPTDQVPPSFADTRSTLEAVHRSVSKLLARKLELDPDPVDVSGAASDDSAGPLGVATPTAGPPTSKEDACRRVSDAARYLREQDPTDPGPYLMVRGLRWGELRAGGHTLDPRQLAAPPTATRTKLKGLLLDGAWAQLLEAGEEVMASPFGRGWLDLQRYILSATDALGGEYEPVGLAIRGALRALLKDLPELAEATLMDDTPTANRETRGWLRDEGLFGDFSESTEAELEVTPQRTSSGPERDGVARVIQRARSESQGGRQERAIKLLQEQAAREPTHRGRFLLRTETAAIMLDAGHDAVALPILRQLHEESMTAQTLTDWEESSLVARPMALLYRCAGALQDSSVDRDALYLEVCRLDPVMAIDLKEADRTARDDQADEAESTEDG